MRRNKKVTPPQSATLKNIGIFTVQDAEKRQINRIKLYRWVKEEKIRKVAAGLFLHPDSELSYEDLDYAVACMKFGTKSAVGGLSALFKHGLIEQVPSQIWMLVPTNVKTQNIRYRCIRIGGNLRLGIDDHGHFRMAGVERAILEAMKYSTKFGERIAIQSARKAIQDQKTTPKKLGEMAKKLNLEKIFSKFWEAIVA
jgi:predicted transcriptional regulator of viral defense system